MTDNKVHIQYFETCKQKLEADYWKPSNFKKRQKIEETIDHCTAAVQALKLCETLNCQDDWEE